MANDASQTRFRIGIDLGGTKIAATALRPDGQVLPERRIPAPRDDYQKSLQAIADLTAECAAEAPAGCEITVGIGMPGSISRATGLVQNANSTWLNGKAFADDLAHALPYPLRLANDANCLALSEAADGAGAGSRTVFAVILGTGCGGGLIANGQLLEGARRIAGEWGHNPLPWPAPDERPGPLCWCGRNGCLEAWISGPGLAADHQRRTGEVLTSENIVERAAAGDTAASESRQLHLSRIARGLAHVANIVDPDVIVLGGGLSQIPDLYTRLPPLITPLLFTDDKHIDIRPARWGDASGVRGAARLWPGTPDD